MNILIFTDFDGTITKRDIGDELFKKFSEFEPHHSQLLSGELSIYDYWHIVCSKISDNIGFEDISSFAVEEEIDHYFLVFAEYCYSVSLPLTIISDGFDAYIKPITQKHGLQNIPLFCNKLIKQKNGKYEPQFPLASESCNCMCASCKRNAILTNTDIDDIIIYIGDGISDRCVAEHSDVVFAKKNLAAYCNEKRIPHYPFKSFFDVIQILKKLLTNKIRLKQRHQAYLLRKNAFETE